MKYLGLIILFILFPIYLLFPASVVNIYPIDKMQTSGIYVKEGDVLKFEVSGQWTLWDKFNLVGGEGHQFIANEYGNWGALLGKIGDGESFLIGTGRGSV